MRIASRVQRKDLANMEKARVLDMMMIKQFGYTQRALGETFGKSEAWVSRHLRC